MSKPRDEHRVMCPDCRRPKLLFESEKKANLFIKYNAEDIETGGRELRSYYCPACCAWHISSHEFRGGYAKRTDEMIERFRLSHKTSMADMAYNKIKRRNKYGYESERN